MISYVMTAEENYDSTRISAIADLETYASNVMATDQNYQGIQWDAVRRNLMYMYYENTVLTPDTNTTGFTLWDGETAIEPGGAIQPYHMFNSSVGVKNIDTGAVTLNLNYDSANLVPNGIGGGDGTWRRYTRDFQAVDATAGQNGPGMTDPHTGNFWVNGQSCILYCFRLEDDYSQVISPLRPVLHADNIMQIVGFTDQEGASWSYVREIDERGEALEPATAYLYLTPREFTEAETTADELLIYATFEYPVENATARDFHPYNRELFDHSGNMYLASCAATGGKDFKLYRFEPPSEAPLGGPTVGGGFTDITPWGEATGPNGDGTDYTLGRLDGLGNRPHTSSIIPLYLPEAGDLVLIEKFFPAEKEAASVDPALMFWSCTYVGDPSGTPTFVHHSAFVTGYMTEEWTTTDIDGADYAVVDAFEVNRYLGQSDYEYDIDYTKRWFFFLCTKMEGGVSDGRARIVLVEYKFESGAAPQVLQVIDEQGWDDAYPNFAEHETDAYEAHTGSEDAAGVATAMQTIFNFDELNPLWDVGIYDPETNCFWWSGGGTDSAFKPFFSLFDSRFLNRTADVILNPSGGEIVGATPPFLKLSFGEVDQTPRLRVWGYSLDGHDIAVFRLGASETLIYDLTTQQWAEWTSPDLPYWRLHVGQNWVGMASNSVDNGSDIVAGDDTLGVLYILDPTAGQDDDPTTGTATSFQRKVTGGISLGGRDVVPCGAVTLDLALGSPVATGSAISLLTSDDAGHTWLNHGSHALVAGQYSVTVEWRSLGLARAPGRVFSFVDNGATTRISFAALR